MTRRALLLTLLLYGQVTGLGPAAGLAAAARVTYVTSAALPGIPLIRQGYNQCGPASLQMILAYWGLGMDQTQIGRLTKPDPRAYMGVAVISAFASSVGLASMTMHGASLNTVRALVAQGIPVLALSYFNTPGAVPHWRVVSGFDDASGTVLVHDPLAGYIAIRYADFEALRTGLGNVIAALYPPGYGARVQGAIRT